MSRIKIISIGSGASYVLNVFLARDSKNVDCIAVNSNIETLDHSAARIKILIGKDLTHGIGACSNPIVGREITLLSNDEIRAALEGAKLVIILACLGGGTSTGGAPVIAEIAKETGAEVVAVVSIPFTFEGTRRHERAEEGLAILKDKVDSVIVVPYQAVLTSAMTETKLRQAFDEPDRVMCLLMEYVAGFFSSLVFDDVNEKPKEKLLVGEVVCFGFGTATGEKRAIKAMINALPSILLAGHDINSSYGILVEFTGSANMQLSEINDVMSIISDLVGSNDNISFTMEFDEKAGDSIGVTVILFDRPCFHRSQKLVQTN